MVAVDGAMTREVVERVRMARGAERVVEHREVVREAIVAREANRRIVRAAVKDMAVARWEGS